MARARKPSENPKTQARQVARALALLYPEANCALIHENAFQLLVATILSAQCTDARVNMVTPALFRRFPDANAMAAAELPEIEELVRSTGFFRFKAKHIKEMAVDLVHDHGGEVPADLEALTRLAGVGRKTANVVLGTAHGIASGVVVDTHVKRLAFRLGMTRHTQPEQIERDLMAELPRTEWVEISHRLILHGRRVCDARKPHCTQCEIATICPKAGVTRFQ